MVLIIALLHTMGVFVIGALLLKSRVATTAGAVVVSIIAVSTGRSVYLAMDLLGVALGVWLSFVYLKSKGTDQTSAMGDDIDAKAERLVQLQNEIAKSKIGNGAVKAKVTVPEVVAAVSIPAVPQPSTNTYPVLTHKKIAAHRGPQDLIVGQSKDGEFQVVLERNEVYGGYLLKAVHIPDWMGAPEHQDFASLLGRLLADAMYDLDHGERGVAEVVKINSSGVEEGIYLRVIGDTRVEISLIRAMLNKPPIFPWMSA